jgi:ADP-ribose pyrophosphatase YjhB (NUDIX family)
MDNMQAAVMLVIKDGKILSVSRRDDKTRFGLCGGKMNKLETPEECAKRECAEETGVNVKTCVPIFTRMVPAKKSGSYDFHVHCFYATDWEGEPKNKEDGIEVKWLSEFELTNNLSNGGLGAFPEYNTQSISAFKKMFPEIKLTQGKKEFTCQNCKRPIRPGGNGFCEDLSDKCWKEWNVRQRMPKMPTLR